MSNQLRNEKLREKYHDLLKRADHIGLNSDSGESKSNQSIQ